MVKGGERGIPICPRCTRAEGTTWVGGKCVCILLMVCNEDVNPRL